MTEDASLDRFAEPDAPESEGNRPADAGEAGADRTGADPDDSRADDGDPSVEEADTDESADAPETVDAAVSTYSWSSGSGECAACGASVERRWRADGERGGDLVCADCKEW
ncbi:MULTISPECIES: hypothetical protein [Halorussus]|uniref:DUF7573 domain-containing protein n=1 Tax=Halorussus TaxID=1070314 RepID=UPI000E21561E|nr:MULTISPECIES: hypothetical protein [Halorussus]NHN61133.1 hypothetical protein [Halorussus sp. JP-T4]